MIDAISQLKAVFRLDASASDADLIAAATRCAAAAEEAAEQAEERATVNKLIVQSCGALNEISARQVIKQRSQFETLRKKKICLLPKDETSS